MEAGLAWLVRVLVRAPESASDQPGGALAPTRRSRERRRTRQRRPRRQECNGSLVVSSRWHNAVVRISGAAGAPEQRVSRLLISTGRTVLRREIRGSPISPE